MTSAYPSASACKSSQQYGFTLIELSIVLVIIGLLVGGILTGQDLIRSAAIRGTLSQIDKYNSAAYTFRTKYGYLPGDIPSATACNYGFYCVTGASAGVLGYGNGDGVIQGYKVTSSPTYVDGGTIEGEVLMFFLHLSQAGLIDGMYGAGGADSQVTGATTTGGSSASMPHVTANTTSLTTYEIIPPAKIGNGNFITIGSLSTSWTPTNYFIITGVTSLTTTGSVTSTNNLTPNDAYTIDAKIDDGLPGAGKVYAIDPTGWAVSAHDGLGLITPSSNHCVNGSGSYYIGSQTYINTPNCSLRIEFY